MMYVLYLWYVLRHKWFVLLACVQEGLVWRGLVHDLSKLRPSEFIPYARHFYGPPNPGVFVPQRARAFDAAWLQHQKRNPHHWQHWVLLRDDGTVQPIEMPAAYWREMICDWAGAGSAKGTPGDTMAWYRANGGKMQLHPQTRVRVEGALAALEAQREEA